MIILCAGVYSSGSTWIFNIVRKLVAAQGWRAFSLYSPSIGYALAQLRPGAETLVVKSHTVDRDFWALSSLADVRIIRSRRDPRDAVASLMARFDRWYHDAFLQVEQSLVSLASIPGDCRLLDLNYERGFTRDVATVHQLADFLGCTVTPEDAAKIFASLEPKRVVESIASIVEAHRSDLPPSAFDPGTHWQASHLRSGATGTWPEKLDALLATTVVDAMEPLIESNGWHGTPIRWPALLFLDADLQRPIEGGRLRLPGEGSYFLSGPDLFLPSGRWRADVAMRAARSGYDVNATLEVFAGGGSNRVIALRILTILSNGEDQVTMEFDHADERDPLAIRFHQLHGNRGTEVIFGGATLTYLGPSRITRLSDALSVVALS